ncbi:complement factor I [Rana temporaria]|uniref:complement factor I n=1 Tax=Rana temporaria TaxID=8407 RepID=UPI001AAE0698|nr:complement factor I [Rana temporaria]
MKTSSLVWFLLSLACVCIATDTYTQKECLTEKHTYNSCQKVFCDPWKRCVDGKCICKPPYQCPKNKTMGVCTESQRTFLTYCQLKSAECSNAAYRFASNSPCKGKFEISVKKRNGNIVKNNGTVLIKLPGDTKEFPVCPAKWTITEANVACKQLGFPQGALSEPLKASFKEDVQGQHTECLHVTCRGTETSMAECIMKKDTVSENLWAAVNCYKEKRDCTDDEFTCVNEKCIPAEHACNGDDNCGDRSDELCCSDCRNSFHCSSDICIPKHYVCNGQMDCLKGEDEAKCKVEGSEGEGSENRENNEGKDHNLKGERSENNNDDVEPQVPQDKKTDLVNAVNFDIEAEIKLIKESISSVSCGIPVKQPDIKRFKRIIGGTKAKENQFPWQVAIKDGAKVNCGGIYIGGCWVLTAAHCVRADQPHKYRVIIELLDRLSVSENVDSFPVKTVKVHENYKSGTYENDIALLEVVNIYKEPACMQVDNNLVPACVPWSTHLFKTGDTCVVSGWGREEGFTKVFHLKWGNINLMNNCTSIYKDRFLNGMECAGTYDGSIDACKGDSGGPLICYDANNVAYVWGVVSWGENCGVAGFPGVYSKVAYYFEWISRHVGRALISKYNI